MAMELRHLRYFVAVAQHGGISQAARALHIAQPALTKQIQDLEEELGIVLVERQARGIDLTVGAGNSSPTPFAFSARPLLLKSAP
jgi:DNA-binding transcriptional LysR family regulator